MIFVSHYELFKRAKVASQLICSINWLVSIWWRLWRLMTLFWWLYIAANWLINFLDLCSLQILYLNDLAHVLLFLRKNFTLGTYRSLNAPLEKTINFLFLSPFVFTFKERIAQQPQEKSTNIFKMFCSLIFAKVDWFYLVNTNLSKGSNKDPKTSSINLLPKQKKRFI